MTYSNQHGDFQPGNLVRVKDNVTLDDGKHKGQRGTVDRLGAYYIYVTVSTSDDAVPFVADEIEHAPLTREDIDALPVGAVIKDSDGDTFERKDADSWTRKLAGNGQLSSESKWGHLTILTLPEHYSPVVLVSTPEPAPEAPTAPDVAARLTALVAEIGTEKADVQRDADALEERRRDLNRKTTLAAQYRAVLADLEAQK